MNKEHKNTKKYIFKKTILKTYICKGVYYYCKNNKYTHCYPCAFSGKFNEFTNKIIKFIFP